MDESRIRELATEGSFQRGMDYYLSGAILKPVRQGTLLRAECRGSGYEPYKVSATLTDEGIEDIRCTCPYNHGGICKHAVALLLTFVRDPEAFHVIPPLDEMLAWHSREELIALIGAIVEEQPELLWRLELLAEGSRNMLADVKAYRSRVEHVLAHRSLEAVEWGMQQLAETADELADAGEWLKAGSLYCTLLAGAVDWYDDEAMAMDEEGGFAVLVGEFTEGLIKCLEEEGHSDDTRRLWLEVLLDAELRDIEIGGIDLAPGAREAILTHAIDEDWTWIEERVRAQISASSNWARAQLVDFLAERHSRAGRREEAAAIIRELGTPTQQAFLLIEEGRIEEAMRLIDRIVAGKPGLVTEFADALVEVGAGEVAVEFVTGHAEGRGPSWLAKYYRSEGNWQAALKWEREAFLKAPSLARYKTLREAGERVGGWEETRVDVLEVIEAKNQIGLLIEIALHEGHVSRAMELLPQLDGWHWRDYRREVAEAAEKDYPQRAAALYREMVEDAIAKRQRHAYRQAAEDLKRLKELYGALGAASEWEEYILNLRRRYARLPALQDELDKARL